MIPIHKKGDKSKVTNKRNVSLTCAACKIFESVISEAVMENATSQALICKEQYAYRKGYSCCTQLLVYQNELARWINDRDSLDIIMFDLRSAFELMTRAE